MRRRARLAATIASSLAVAGCSFLLNDKFSGDEPPATPPVEAGTQSEVGANANDAGADTAVSDAGSDVASDAADAALDPSLIALYTFDDGAPLGVVPDKSGHGHPFDPGAGTVTATGGIHGGAFQCAGSNIGGKVPTLAGSAFPKTGTLSFWMKPTYDAAAASTDRTIIDGWDNTRAHLFVRHVGGDPPELFQYALQPASSNYAFAKGFNVVAQNWAHVVIIWNTESSSAAIIVDQQLLKAAAYDTSPFEPTQQQFSIGEWFIGVIDEIALYDRAMPPGEALLLP